MRQSALWEDGQQITVAQHFGCGFKCRAIQGGVFSARRNRDGLGQVKQPAQHRRSKNAVVHDKADRARAGCHQQHRVDKADMVANQYRCALGRKVVFTRDVKAVHTPRQQQRAKAQQVFRHQHKNVKRDHGIGQTEKQKNLRNGEARLKQRPRQHRTPDDEQGIEDIVGGDDAGAVRDLATQLDQCIHRHAVEPRKQAEQGQVRHYPPVSRLTDESGYAHEGSRRQTTRRKIKIHRKHGHPDGAQRYQPNFDMALAEHFAQQRSRRNADRKNPQQHRRDLFVAVDHFLCKTRELA